MVRREALRTRRLKQTADECRQRAVDCAFNVGVKQSTCLYFDNDRIQRAKNRRYGAEKIVRQPADKISDDRTDNRQTAYKAENRVKYSAQVKKVTAEKTAKEIAAQKVTAKKAENRIKKTKNLTFSLSHFHAAHRYDIDIAVTEKVCSVLTTKIGSAQACHKTCSGNAHYYFFH
jgi:hypothetical protein